MTLDEFDKIQNKPEYDFSEYNVIRAIIFTVIAAIIFTCGFIYQHNQNDIVQQNQLARFKQISQTEAAWHTYWEYKAKQLQEVIDAHQASKIHIVDISAYTPRAKECDSTPDVTAIMKKSRPGYTIAVSHDLKWMLGHRVYIYGYGVYVVEDLMNERYTNRVDIMMDDVEKALKFGVKHKQELIVLGKEIDL